MSLLGRLDSKIHVYRAADVAGPYRDASGSLVLVSSVEKATFVAYRPMLDIERGAGEYTSGTMLMFSRKQLNLKRGDIIKIIGGTMLKNSDHYWRVVSTNQPRGRHNETAVVPHNGKLP